MIRYYDINISGMTKRLPLYLVDEDTCEALFIAFNDVALTKHAAEKLLELVPEFDVILTEEVQGVPLAYEMTRQAGIARYVVARKKAKAHMDDVFAIQVENPGDYEVRKLYLAAEDAEYLRDKRILLVDDCVLYGSTMYALSELANATGGYVVGMAAILMQQDASMYDGLVTLGTLPIFHANGVVKGLPDEKN